jgi:hypothetical protein
MTATQLEKDMEEIGAVLIPPGPDGYSDYCFGTVCMYCHAGRPWSDIEGHASADCPDRGYGGGGSRVAARPCGR